MSPARRPASELPSDPAHLHLRYSHEHAAVPFYGEDTLERWHVSIRAYHGEDEECSGGCADACDQLIDEGTEVGHLRLWRLREDTGADRLMIADGQSGDLESIVSAVLDDGEYSAAFQETIDCPVGDLLILDRVFLSKHWRGFGLGPVFAAEAIRRLSRGCCAVAAEPGMAEWPENDDEVTDAYRTAANEKIANLWETIGFRPFRRGIQLLDTALQRPIDLHRQRREDLQALSRAHRSSTSNQPATPIAQLAARLTAEVPGSS